MKKAAGLTAADDSSHYAVSAFTHELIDDLARNRYSLRAWRTLLSRSWSRSIDDIRKSPERMRSVYWWVAIVAAVGTTVILLTLFLQTPDRALAALVFWLPWYVGAVFFLVTHIGMVDDEYGLPRKSLLLANGLSFSRLGLAPLVIWPCLQVPVVSTTAPFFALFLIMLSISDLLDGWIARRQKLCTRMGRMLDVLADLAFITFLATGLYMAGIIPLPLLLLMIVRYPLLLLAVLIMYFLRGPAPLRPTLIGKLTTFTSSIVLLIFASKILLLMSWPTPSMIEWSVWFLYLLISANIIYIFRWGANWHELKH
jgi:cardiolipin synthase